MIAIEIWNPRDILVIIVVKEEDEMSPTKYEKLSKLLAQLTLLWVINPIQRRGEGVYMTLLIENLNSFFLVVLWALAFSDN